MEMPETALSTPHCEFSQDQLAGTVSPKLIGRSGEVVLHDVAANECQRGAHELACRRPGDEQSQPVAQRGAQGLEILNVEEIPLRRLIAAHRLVIRRYEFRQHTELHILFHDNASASKPTH